VAILSHHRATPYPPGSDRVVPGRRWPLIGALGLWKLLGEGGTPWQYVGDHVIPLYTPECRACSFCPVGKTNCDQAIVAPGPGPDGPIGTSRFSKNRQAHLSTYMVHLHFSEYTVSATENRPRGQDQWQAGTLWSKVWPSAGAADSEKPFYAL